MPTPTVEIQDLSRRLRRRVTVASFANGALDAAWAVLLVGVVVLLTARLLGLWLAPQASWAFAGAIPIGYGLWRARQQAWSESTAAVRLDRQLGLGGLMVTGLEVDAHKWDGHLRERLAETEAGLPALTPTRWMAHALLIGGLATAILLLPKPELPDPAAGSVSQALEGAVEDVTEDIDLALEDGVVSEARGEELQQRARDLEMRLEAGEEIGWGDVDALADRLAQEQISHVGGLQTLEAGLRDLDDKSESPMSHSLERTRELWKRAAALELFEDLPEETRQKLEAAAKSSESESAVPQDGSATDGLSDLLGQLDPTELGLDEETMQRLLDQLGQEAVDKLKKLGEAGRLPKGELESLDKLLAERGLEPGGKKAAADEPGAMGPGDGSVDRGPGAADLHFSHETDPQTGSLKFERLAPSAAIPEEWQAAGVSRAVPVFDPQAPGAMGGGAVGGSGDATAWRRRLAPRHRDAVRRFFSAGRDR